MELDVPAAAAHQRIRHALAHDGEVELVGLQAGAGLAAALETGLDEATLVGLPHPALVDELVQLTCLDALSEHEEELEVARQRSGHQQDADDPGDDFSFG